MLALARLATLVLAVAGTAAAAHAGAVSIDELTDGTLTLTAEAATVDEILDGLNDRSAFEFERFGDDPLARTYTRSYTGTPRQILEQLLANESHVLVMSNDGTVIERVVLFGRPKPESPAQAANATPQSPGVAKSLVAPTASVAQPLPPPPPLPVAQPVATAPATPTAQRPHASAADRASNSRRTAMNTVGVRARQ